MYEQLVYDALEKFRKVLPHQGPLGVFVHQNTLQFLEHKKFECALFEAKEIYGAHVLPSFEFFQRMIAANRLTLKYFTEELGDQIPITLHPLLFEILTKPRFSADEDTIQWELRQNLSIGEKEKFKELKNIVKPTHKPLARKKFEIQASYIEEEKLIGYFSNILDQGIRTIGIKESKKISEPSSLILQELMRLEISPTDFFVFLCQAAKGFFGWFGMIELYHHHPEMFPRTMPNHLSLEEALICRLKMIQKVIITEKSDSPDLRLQATIIEILRALRFIKTDLPPEIFPLIERYDSFSRQLLCLKTVERSFRESKINEIISGQKGSSMGIEKSPQITKYQAIFCLDEREESFRRHIEKASDAFETLGAAGFFGIDFIHHDEDRRLASNLCPIQVTPSLKILSRKNIYDFERSNIDATAMALKVSTILRLTGLRKDFAKLVFIVSHGSTTTNNTHFSAYQCGACGGQKGYHNARVYCQMINRKDVRIALKDLDIFIPEETWFVASYHDTSLDNMTYYDEKEIPTQLHREFYLAKEIFDQAAEENALERSTRLEDFLPRNAKTAKKSLQKRARSIAQARPEYGHATNALFVIGPRSLTKNIFFDRRCFMFSYEPDGDPEGKNITEILRAAVPVCAGISLEYYFSSVDNDVFGCGSKVAHNVHGLFGVSNGAYSDLRTGLPLQTVEIHEPMRILVIAFAKKEFVENAVADHLLLTPIVKNEWIQTVIVDPRNLEASLFIDGSFQRIKNLS